MYPPGNKDAIDWGALAGKVQQGPGTPPCAAVRHLLLADKDIAALPGGAASTTAWQGQSSYSFCDVGRQCGGQGVAGFPVVHSNTSNKAKKLQCHKELPIGTARSRRVWANSCPGRCPCSLSLHVTSIALSLLYLLDKMARLLCIVVVLQAMTTRSVRLRIPCCWRCSTLRSMMTLPNEPARATPATSPGLSGSSLSLEVTRRTCCGLGRTSVVVVCRL